MDTTSENDKKMIPPNSADPQSIDDVESGHVGGSAPPPIDNGDSGHEGGSARLKRGHWTSAEDAILVDYVLKHGEGKWNNIQKDSVLARCGKSCRLRWINHLRPDLKKGEFTLAEERKVVELHAMMGNKWSLMAPELPGRTDNEIKNFWNTRVRRHQRLGLPLYPPGITPQSLNENQQNDDTIAFSSGDPYRPDFFPDNNTYIPVLDFKSPEHDQPLFPPSLLDISASSLPSQIQNVYDHGLTSDLASSSSMFLGSHELPSIQTQTSSLGMVQIPPTECTQPCDLAVDDDEFLEALLNDSRSMTNMENSYLQQNSHAFDMAIDGGDILEVVLAESKDMNNMKNYYDQQNSHAPDMATDDCDFLEAILNESRSLNIMKNNSHQQNSHASEMATDDSDYLGAVLHESRRLNNIQNNYHAQNTHASDMATDDSDLLEAVLHESKSINNRKNNYQQQNSHASDVALDEMDIFARDSHETNWEDRSPFGGCSLDEEPLSISDYLLDSNSFDHMDTNKDHALFGDANGALFSDDDLRWS